MIVIRKQYKKKKKCYALKSKWLKYRLKFVTNLLVFSQCLRGLLDYSTDARIEVQILFRI